VIGITVDIPYLLRTICAFAPFISATWKFTYTPEMAQLLQTTPPQPSTREPRVLRLADEHLNEWWTEERGDIAALNMELLQVAYKAPKMMVETQVTANPMHSTISVSGLTTSRRSAGSCSQCTASAEIARRAMVALKDCALHMEASRQFAEWSTGQSQRLIQACRQLCLEQRKMGNKLGLQDLERLGGKDPTESFGGPEHDQATTYPSADGIDWALFSNEDTQGPLLSPHSSGAAEALADCSPPAPEPLYSTEGLIGQDGFNIERWAAGIPEMLIPHCPSVPIPVRLGENVPRHQDIILPPCVDAFVKVPSAGGRNLSHLPTLPNAGQVLLTNTQPTPKGGAPHISSDSVADPLIQSIPEIDMADTSQSPMGANVSSGGL
jgi:hypothetical protein